MATDHYVVTNTPTDVVAANSLEVGKKYQGQYIGPSVLRSVAAAAAPEASDPALQVTPRQTFAIVPVTGEGIYLWVNEAGGTVIINEVT